MKQFNLQDYLENGGDVVTREGLPVEILKTDYYNGFAKECVIGVVTFDGGSQILKLWHASGHYYEQGHTINDSESDLFFKEKWYDNIPEGGILCWVWDSGLNDYQFATYIILNDHGVFINTHNTSWYNAQPVKPEELIGGIEK